jgi:hypothetical protein
MCSTLTVLNIREFKTVVVRSVTKEKSFNYSFNPMAENWKPYLCNVNGEACVHSCGYCLWEEVPIALDTLAAMDVGTLSIAAAGKCAVVRTASSAYAGQTLQIGVAHNSFCDEEFTLGASTAWFRLRWRQDAPVYPHSSSRRRLPLLFIGSLHGIPYQSLQYLLRRV